MVQLMPQLVVIPIHVDDINDAADDIGDSSQGKAGRQADGFLQAAHQQRADADADVIGQHVGCVGNAALGGGGSTGYKGLEQRLQNAIAKSEEITCDQHVYAGGQKEVACHRANQNHQADIDQNAVLGGINHLLCG